MNRIASFLMLATLSTLSTAVAALETSELDVPTYDDSCLAERAALSKLIDTRGDFNYQLLVVNNDQIGVGDLIIGNCEGDSRKVVFVYSETGANLFFAGL